MVHSSNESQQTQTFSIDHENVLPEHYRLIELIGRGGMAEVYLAEDRRLGRKVAIKFLNPEFRRDPDRVRRFRQEARSASALNHPNILIIHDIGDRGGVQFIVSELVEGETLGTRIAQGRLPFAEAADIAIQAASALTAAHSAGIVHRDIKPDNVMIRRDGVVKVLDFGLAKARGFTTSNGSQFDALTLDSGSTSPGLIVGTPQYMSPEQARGRELDGRTDIFSFGIIIFEMVTRHSPFASGSFADTMAAILTKEPRRLDEFVEDAPRRLVELIEKCLKKQRDERFSSMAEVETELKLLRGELIENPRATAEVDPVKSDRTQIRPTDQHSIRRFVSDTFRKPSPIAAVIILVTAGLLIGGWWAWDRFSALSTQPSLMRTVPIASWASAPGELETAGSFSPNGRMIAFAARRGEASELWVRSTVGGNPIQITKGGFSQYPVWSPDGEEVAFLGLQGSRALFRMSFTGGDQVRILGLVDPSARPVLWGRSGRLYYESKSELFALDLRSGEVAQITSIEKGGVRPRIVEISGDESKIAYSIKEPDGYKVRVQDIGAKESIVVASSAEQIDYIAWSPNGQSLFCSMSTNGAFQIYDVRLDGAEPKLRSNGSVDLFVQDISVEGNVLYSSQAESSDLWSVDIREGAEKIVANDVTAEFWPDVGPDGRVVFQAISRVGLPYTGTVRIAGKSSQNDSGFSVSDGFSPTWSPNGEWIAFFRRVGRETELWRARPTGDDALKLAGPGVRNSAYIATPYLKVGGNAFAWSPDSGMIAYSAMDGEVTNVYSVKVDGTETRKLTDNVSQGVGFFGLAWSRNGRSLMFASENVRESSGRSIPTKILLFSMDSESVQTIYESSDGVRILGLINNGSDVLFIRRSDPNDSAAAPKSTDLFALPLNGGTATRLMTLANVYFNNVHLSPDQTLIACLVQKEDGGSALSLVPVFGGSAREIVRQLDPKVLVSSLAWAPDGRSIVFGKQTRTSLLSMLTD